MLGKKLLAVEDYPLGRV